MPTLKISSEVFSLYDNIRQGLFWGKTESDAAPDNLFFSKIYFIKTIVKRLWT